MSRSLAAGKRKGNSGNSLAKRRLKLRKLPLLIFDGPIPRVICLDDPREDFVNRYNAAGKRHGYYAAVPEHHFGE